MQNKKKRKSVSADEKTRHNTQERVNVRGKVPSHWWCVKERERRRAPWQHIYFVIIYKERVLAELSIF